MWNVTCTEQYVLINTYMGIYEFLRMPFGLAGAPHLFEKVIKEI
jgi:hypothetical protein